MAGCNAGQVAAGGIFTAIDWSEMRSSDSTLVWDLSTRLFHWCLPPLLLGLWGTAEFGYMEWHQYLGFALAGLLCFRWCWGLVGGHYARFAQFLRGPRVLWAYCRGRYQSAGGHNPLGGWMVLMMLLLLTAQVMTGLFANDDMFMEGPLYSWVSKALSDELTRWHYRLFDGLLIVITLHILAIGWYQLRGKRLVEEMWHGYQAGAKPMPYPVRSLWLSLSWGAGLLVSVILWWLTDSF